MGHWGTSIKSNDTYADIYDDFFDLYNDGKAVGEITISLKSKYADVIEDKDDSNNFWFSLAKAQWECKALDIEVFAKVKNIIESGDDLRLWKELGSDDKQLKLRAKVLDKFLAELSVERAVPKKRKKKVILQPIFEKGDCLTFQLSNGHYGGAIVLEAIKDSEFGLNLIASTRINQSKKPTIEEFKNSKILILTFGEYKSRPDIGWHYAQFFKKSTLNFEKVGQLTVDLDYDPQGKELFYFSGQWDRIKEIVTSQFDHEKVNGRLENEENITKYTKKPAWKFW
jgi:hypothetical protein